LEVIDQLLANSLETGTIMAIILAFAGGVLASASPCIYPLIPITVSVIGGTRGRNRLSGFFYSLIYVLGLAIVYGGLGLIAAASGRLFGEISTSPVSYFLVANISFFFSFWMMGWVNIPQFGFAQTSNSDGQQAKLSKRHVFTMGAVSGLVAAPCTAPVLGILLAYVASQGEVVFGGILLFAFAYGMGAILILIGTFSGLASKIPKSGAWMNKVKLFFALLMFGMGQYYLIELGKLIF
jgi:cytochrome c-type biogenesis protein